MDKRTERERKERRINMEKQKRKSLTKKVRFEVFKRDSFTCQYCGRTAPSVILEVDHIKPVCDGGQNELINLITSCFDCNRGKGKRRINSNNELKLQQEKLLELSKKREQMEMLLKWRDELSNFEDDQVLEIEARFDKMTGYSFDKGQMVKVSKWIKKFGLIEVIECMEISIKQYLKSDNDIDKVFNYIPRIAETRRADKNDPMIAKRNYIKGILYNRLSYINNDILRRMLFEIECDKDFQQVKKIAASSGTWTEFKVDFNYWCRGDY